MALLRLDVGTMKESTEAISHYKRKILRSLDDDEQEVTLYCLEKLAKIIVNVEVLQETNVGRVINNLRKHENETISLTAKEIVCAWRDIVQQEEEAKEEEEEEEKKLLEVKASKVENGYRSQPSSSLKKEHKSKHPEVKEEQSRKRKSSQDSDEEKKKRKDESRERDKKQKGEGREGEKAHKDKVREHHHKESAREREKHHKDSVNDREREKNKEKEREREKNKKDSHREREKNHKDKDSSRSGSKSHKNKSKGGDSMGFEDALLAVSKESSKKSSKSSTSSDRKSKSKGQSSKVFAPPQPPPLPPLFDLPCDISPNYVPQKRPLPTALTTRHNPSNGKFQDESLSALISMSRNSRRTAVYSGSKRSAFSDSVPTLFQLCIHVLQEHVDDIAECGGLPYHVLEPVLERAKPETLLTIEEYNPYLVEDTGGLWERICRREFPREQRQEFESWREVYDRCLTERQQKLDFLTVKVQQSYKNVQTTSRKAKLAYVDTVAKPPREVQRAQDKNGTAATPSMRETVKKMGGPPRPRGEGRMRADGFQAAAKAKKSPMMIKTLKLMHGIKTNFRK